MAFWPRSLRELGTLIVGGNLLWLDHPKFRAIRDETLAQFRAKDVHFRKVKSVIFLCGAAQSSRRDRLAQYLKKQWAEDVLVFYADDVWPVIAGRPGLNALQMERELASLSDLVLIVVESAGTFAELGAFSLSDPLRRKLLPLVDVKYRNDPSFINTGPIKWIDDDSLFGPTIWVDHNSILTAVPEIDDRMSRLPPRTSARVLDLAASPKHLVFFICDVVSVFGPCPTKHVEFYVQQTLQSAPSVDTSSLVALAKAMGLICEVPGPTGIAFYYRPLTNGTLQSFQQKKYLELPVLRARVLSVLQSIKAGGEALQAIGSNHAAR